VDSPPGKTCGASGSSQGGSLRAGWAHRTALGFPALIALFTAAATFGQTDDLQWNFDERNRMVLTIPASRQSRLFQVIRYSGQSDAQLLSLAGYLGLLKLKNELPDPAQRLKGGKQRWPEVITTKGTIGSNDEAYTLDTLTLPGKVPGSVWLRTSALAFFPDGRMAVCTHGGDVWIVSGGGSGVTARCIVGAAEASPNAGATFVLLGRTRLDASIEEWLEDDESALQARKMELREDMIAQSESGKITMVEWDAEWNKHLRSLEIHRTILDIQATGNRALYDACDVTNSKSVSKVLTAVRKECGLITGVVHGAGLEDSKLVADKSWETFSKVISVKIDGWRALIDALGDELDQLRVLCAFTSVAGRFDVRVTNFIKYYGKTMCSFQNKHGDMKYNG